MLCPTRAPSAVAFIAAAVTFVVTPAIGQQASQPLPPPRIITNSPAGSQPQSRPVTWQEIPADLKQFMLPPPKAIAYCIAQANAGDEPSVQRALGECMDFKLVAYLEVFSACHKLSEGAHANLYFERRHKCMLELGAKIGG